MTQGQCSGQGNNSKRLTDTGYLDFCLWKYLLIHRLADFRKLIQVPEIQRDYRERKKKKGVAKKPRKMRNEIQWAYREQKKLEDDKTYVQR